MLGEVRGVLANKTAGYSALLSVATVHHQLGHRYRH